MAWGKRNSGTPPPIPAADQGSPDLIISEMLSAYHKHFYEKVRGGPDKTAEEAYELVERARFVIQQSRVGYSICALVETVKHWPAWLKRGNFPEKIQFPATNISGSEKRINDDKFPNKQITVHFTYSGTQYTLVFLDEGFADAENDPHIYGKAEFFVADVRVLGLDISAKRDSYAERWAHSDVFAFTPGDWMKHVVEIGAHIDAYDDRLFLDSGNDEIIRRASQIKL